MSKINEITPIRDGMSQIEAKQATKLFLQELLIENLLRNEDIEKVENKTCGSRGYTLITLKDGSSWVQGDKGLERLIGAVYLKNNLSVDKWTVAEAKCFLKDPEKNYISCSIKKAKETPLEGVLAIQSKDFITCSKYVGDKKPDFPSFLSDTDESSESSKPKYRDKNTITMETGYNDFMCNANLRVQEDGTIIIIDTEYGSFSNSGAISLSSETNIELGGMQFDFPIDGFLG